MSTDPKPTRSIEVDNQELKERIVKILKAYKDLYSEKPDEQTDEDKQLREIFVGRPERIKGHSMPFAYVTNHDQYHPVVIPRGALRDGVVSQQEHVVKFVVIVVAEANTLAETEKQLDHFDKRIREILNSYPQLTDPDETKQNINAESNPLVKLQMPTIGQMIEIQEAGVRKSFDGIQIDVECKLYTGYAER